MVCDSVVDSSLIQHVPYKAAIRRSCLERHSKLIALKDSACQLSILRLRPGHPKVYSKGPFKFKGLSNI